MKKPIAILANWKSNKTIKEAEEWVKEVSNFQFPIFNFIRVILCPPFISLPTLKRLILKYKLPVKLGSQDVSPFENGPYTGEISARMLKDLADYVIIGHSERRKYFGETDKMVVQKVKLAVKYGLIPVVCISNLKQVDYLTKDEEVRTTSLLILYEPLFAIGSGQPDTPGNANKMAFKIKGVLGKETKVLYGGSINPKNVASFLSQPEVFGVGVGGASLDPQEFLKIIENALKI